MFFNWIKEINSHYFVLIRDLKRSEDETSQNDIILIRNNKIHIFHNNKIR